MSVDLDDRRAQLLDLRSRVLGAAHDIVGGDVADGELSNAGGDQHLADHATDLFDHELDDSLGVADCIAECAGVRVDATLGALLENVRRRLDGREVER